MPDVSGAFRICRTLKRKPKRPVAVELTRGATRAAHSKASSAPGQRRSGIARELHKQGHERPVLLDQNTMFIEPTRALLHEIGAIRATREPSARRSISAGVERPFRGRYQTTAITNIK
jgi:hypothetical protein